MSIYGKVKKVGSSTFQFDRVYVNRVAMEQAMAEDGVYAGRYALVEYGQRYTNTQEYADQPISHYTGTNTPVYECRAYLASKEADLTAYGAIYDSTVWQKIYTENGDKYIMVAELNATVPNLDLIKDAPLHYEVENNTTQVSKVYVGEKDALGKLQNVTVVPNAKETYNEAHFDEHVDTEASYQLHIPKNVQLNANNENVNYNEHGFDMAYSFGTDDSETVVGWVTDDLVVDGQNRLSATQDLNSKTFYMNMPAFGNVMNSLYDLLYGRPEGDLSEGELRPYFERYVPVDENNDRTVAVMVRNSNNQLVPLQTNYTIDLHTRQPDRYPVDYKTVTGHIGEDIYPQVVYEEEVPTTAEDTSRYIIPDNVIIVKKLSSDNYIKITSIADDQLANSDDLFFAYNKDVITDSDVIKVKIKNTGISDTDRSWLKDVPALSDLLENNTAGLATILQSLFGYADPFTGTTRYYLYTNWQTKEDENSSIPAIQGKPEIVGGYALDARSRINYYDNLDTVSDTTDENGITELITKMDMSNWSEGDYIIDYDTWQLGTYIDNSLMPEGYTFNWTNTDDAELFTNIPIGNGKTYFSRNWGLTLNYRIGEKKVQNTTTNKWDWTMAIRVSVKNENLTKGGAGTKHPYAYYRVGSDLNNNEYCTFETATDIIANADYISRYLVYTFSTDDENAYENITIPIYMIGYDADPADGQSPTENDVMRFTFFKPSTT